MESCNNACCDHAFVLPALSLPGPSGNSLLAREPLAGVCFISAAVGVCRPLPARHRSFFRKCFAPPCVTHCTTDLTLPAIPFLLCRPTEARKAKGHHRPPLILLGWHLRLTSAPDALWRLGMSYAVLQGPTRRLPNGHRPSNSHPAENPSGHACHSWF